MKDGFTQESVTSQHAQAQTNLGENDMPWYTIIIIAVSIAIAFEIGRTSGYNDGYMVGYDAGYWAEEDLDEEVVR